MKTPFVGNNGFMECMHSLSFTVETRLVESLKSRFDPFMTCYFATELSGPIDSKGSPLPTTWIAVEDTGEKIT